MIIWIQFLDHKLIDVVNSLVSWMGQTIGLFIYGYK
jgi:hypothetical protein